jgi:PAS domain S-box-containing protein
MTKATSGPSPRLFLVIGVAVLIAISAASIGLDVKWRSDARRVDHTLEVLKQFSELQLLITRAESAARGFYQTSDQRFSEEHNTALGKVAPAFAELAEMIRDNPVQVEALERTRLLVVRRFAVLGELMRRQEAGDAAAIAARTAIAEGRALMQSVNQNFDKLAKEEQRLLTVHSMESRQTERLLLAVDTAGAGLILLLASILISDTRRDRRLQAQELRASNAANELLEAAVAERTQELRHSMAVLHSTFNSMTEAVLVLDIKGDILLANPAAEELFGYRPGMTVAQLWELLTPYQADGTTPLARSGTPASRTIRGEQFEGQEIVLYRQGRPDPVQVVASSRALYDSSGQLSGGAVVYRDVTGVRETERRLLQSQRLEAIGNLTGGIAHDFNNMITVITGMTETLVDSLQGQPELLQVVELIDQAADRCSALIRHLLAFARRQPLQPRHVDVNATIEDLSKLLTPTLGEQIELRFVLQGGIPTARVDPSQLANALLNLAFNARDAMPDGGKLTLETARVYLDEAYAQQNEDVRPGTYVMIAVSDTGTGMPSAVLEKIFEPFFTTKQVGKGSGLGLSMVFGFVKQSNGNIKAYSEPGHGTTIKLYLPSSNQPADVLAPSLVPMPGGAETILVVEDEAMLRDCVVAQLRGLGYRTVAVTDSRAALAEIDGDQDFDLLFTDLIMPGGMTGRQLADEITRRRPGIKVLFTSGYTENASVHHGRLDQDVILLSKPYRKSELARMLRLVLGATEIGPLP